MQCDYLILNICILYRYILLETGDLFQANHRTDWKNVKICHLLSSMSNIRIHPSRLFDGLRMKKFIKTFKEKVSKLHKICCCFIMVNVRSWETISLNVFLDSFFLSRSFVSDIILDAGFFQQKKVITEKYRCNTRQHTSVILTFLQSPIWWWLCLGFSDSAELSHSGWLSPKSCSFALIVIFRDFL